MSLIINLTHKVNQEHTAKLACLEKNRDRIEAFGALMCAIGCDSERVGKFVESCVVHWHTGKVNLRLQLCAEGEPVEWIVRNVADLETRLGHRLHFIERNGIPEATIQHPACGQFSVVISGDARFLTNDAKVPA